MKLKDYPKEIQELIVKRVKDTTRVKIRPNLYLTSAFLWDYTPEGFCFWEKINDGNLQPFYDKYPVPDTRVKK